MRIPAWPWPSLSWRTASRVGTPSSRRPYRRRANRRVTALTRRVRKWPGPVRTRCAALPPIGQLRGEAALREGMEEVVFLVGEILDTEGRVPMLPDSEIGARIGDQEALEALVG